MKAFDDQHASLTLSDVARIVGLPRASARRALLTLQSLGYVESSGRLFSLSPQVLTLARAYVKKLLDNARVLRFLSQKKPDLLKEFQQIVDATSLEG